jgi:hypothetical protein
MQCLTSPSEIRLTERNSPGSSQHKETDEHDRRILNETKATTDPITNNSNKDLPNDYTDDFKILDGLDPCLVADGRVVAPTSRERTGK